MRPENDKLRDLLAEILDTSDWAAADLCTHLADTILADKRLVVALHKECRRGWLKVDSEAGDWYVDRLRAHYGWQQQSRVLVVPA